MSDLVPSEIIMNKRMGRALTREEIDCFVRGAVDGSFADYQLAALLMAICIQGMDDRETVDLTMSMAASGEMLDLSAIEGIKADKHSTGGVGDTTTLIVAPLVAACGVKVAKMSGRGLGFTGGTLDKLESIPGLNVHLSTARFLDNVRNIGLSVIGQTKALAPADKTLYALRDVTATVDSVPLIASSILSKKIAAGCDVVVLDVKAGSGALMPDEASAAFLAEAMVRIGAMTGRTFRALVTGMDQPLGTRVGNALEVREAIDVLCGRAGGALLEVSLQLGAQILLGARLADSREQGVETLRACLRAGAGAKKLAEMIEAQDGDARVVSDPERLPRAARPVEVRAGASGYVAGMQTAGIGYAALALGAGRARKEAAVDPGAGLMMHKRLGDEVRTGEALCTLHVGEQGDAEAARAWVERSIRIARERPAPLPDVLRVVG